MMNVRLHETHENVATGNSAPDSFRAIIIVMKRATVQMILVPLSLKLWETITRLQSNNRIIILLQNKKKSIKQMCAHEFKIYHGADSINFMNWDKGESNGPLMGGVSF